MRKSTTTDAAAATVRAAEDAWRRIEYHPTPLVTRYYGEDSERYWQGVHRGIIPHSHRFGIKVRIVPAADEIRSYVEPLSAMHGQFWDAASEVCWRLYPFANKQAWRWGGVVHSALAEAYWAHAGGWEEHTPAAWADRLSAMLDAAERTRVRNDAAAAGLRAALEAVWR